MMISLSSQLSDETQRSTGRFSTLKYFTTVPLMIYAAKFFVVVVSVIIIVGGFDGLSLARRFSDSPKFRGGVPPATTPRIALKYEAAPCPSWSPAPLSYSSALPDINSKLTYAWCAFKC